MLAHKGQRTIFLYGQHLRHYLQQDNNNDNTTANPSTTAVTTVGKSQSTATTCGAMSVTTISATTTTTAGTTIGSFSVRPTTSTTTTRPISNVTLATNTETNITTGINVGGYDRQIYDLGMQLTEIQVQIWSNLSKQWKGFRERERQKGQRTWYHRHSITCCNKIDNGTGKKTAQ